MASLKEAVSRSCRLRYRFFLGSRKDKSKACRSAPLLSARSLSPLIKQSDTEEVTDFTLEPEDTDTDNTRESISKRLAEAGLTGKCQSRRRAKQLLTVLLIGPSESGKSTLMKQLARIHDGVRVPPATGSRLRACIKGIRHNVLEGMVLLCAASAQCGGLFAVDSTLEMKRFALVMRFKKQLQQLAEQSLDDDLHLDKKSIADLSLLWADTGIQHTFAMRHTLQTVAASKWQVPEHLAHFMNHGASIWKAEYVPTFEDFVRVKLQSASIGEAVYYQNTDDYQRDFSELGYKYKSKKSSFGSSIAEGLRRERGRGGGGYERYELQKPEMGFRFVDVCGGFRFERQKRRNFPEAIASVYVVAIGDYDTHCVEDGVRWQRMDVALALFECLCQNQFCDGQQLVVFFNKWDVFELKLKRDDCLPFAEAFTDDREEDDELSEVGRDPKRAYKALCAKFIAVVAKHKPTIVGKVIFRKTVAISTANAKKVMRSVQKRILQQCLSEFSEV